jgi:hypothetical protein
MSVPNVLVIEGLLWALFLMAKAIYKVWPVTWTWNGDMGSVRWDASKSWASTFTAVGALLSMVLSSSQVVLPEPKLLMMSKGAYSGLSLFFGALIVLAAFAYNATMRPASVTTLPGVAQKELRGMVVSFLLATTLAVWGASGQIGTLLLLVEELNDQASLVYPAARVFQLLLILVFLILVLYIPRSVEVAIANQTPNARLYKAQVKAQMRSLNMPEPTKVVPPQPEWTLP